MRADIYHEIFENLEESVDSIFLEYQIGKGIKCGDVEPCDSLELDRATDKLASVITDILEKQIEISGLSVDRVYALCNQEGWFTCGSCEQYSRMFDMVKKNAPIHDISMAIWMCSDGWRLENIETILDMEGRK